LSRRVGKSSVELPDAIQFLEIPSERVFQQPQDFPTLIHFPLGNRPRMTSDPTNPMSRSINGHKRVCRYLSGGTVDFLQQRTSQKLLQAYVETFGSAAERVPKHGHAFEHKIAGPSSGCHRLACRTTAGSGSCFDPGIAIGSSLRRIRERAVGLVM
jgi:hypothetical protein